MRKIMMLLLLCPAIASAQEREPWERWLMSYDWDTADTVAEATVATSLVLDWMQTRQMANRPAVRGVFASYERNPLLGSKPSRAEIDRYFVGAIIGHAAVAYVLPRWLRLPWQGITLSVQLSVVSHNYGAGLRFRF